MWSMVIERPYVFAFLAAFLFLAGRRWGWARTLVWLVTGYLIALASEASSIRNGFPYGIYYYKYENLLGDLLIFGVPFWDSLSYPFMIYAGYSVAELLVGRNRQLRPITLAALGAALTMLLDVIIDPVSHRGAEWFLGEIYDYAHPGHYFGIPLSNFAGWWFVPFVVIVTNQLLWKLPSLRSMRRPGPSKLDLAFYCGIAGFGTTIALYLQAWPLAACSSLILIVVMLLTLRRRLP